MKYQPYKGYHYKPWLHYGPRGYPIRLRTKGDWLLKTDFTPHDFTHEHAITYQPGIGKTVCFIEPQYCHCCQKVHCPRCQCNRDWQRWANSTGSVYQKQFAHRQFRRQAKRAIHAELTGNDAVSHHFFISGDWLD